MKNSYSIGSMDSVGSIEPICSESSTAESLSAEEEASASLEAANEASSASSSSSVSAEAISAEDGTDSRPVDRNDDDGEEKLPMNRSAEGFMKKFNRGDHVFFRPLIIFLFSTLGFHGVKALYFEAAYVDVNFYYMNCSLQRHWEFDGQQRTYWHRDIKDKRRLADFGLFERLLASSTVLSILITLFSLPNGILNSQSVIICSCVFGAIGSILQIPDLIVTHLVGYVLIVVVETIGMSFIMSLIINSGSKRIREKGLLVFVATWTFAELAVKQSFMLQPYILNDHLIVAALFGSAALMMLIGYQDPIMAVAFKRDDDERYKTMILALEQRAGVTVDEETKGDFEEARNCGRYVESTNEVYAALQFTLRIIYARKYILHLICYSLMHMLGWADTMMNRTWNFYLFTRCASNFAGRTLSAIGCSIGVVFWSFWFLCFGRHKTLRACLIWLGFVMAVYLAAVGSYRDTCRNFFGMSSIMGKISIVLVVFTTSALKFVSTIGLFEFAESLPVNTRPYFMMVFYCVQYLIAQILKSLEASTTGQNFAFAWRVVFLILICAAYPYMKKLAEPKSTLSDFLDTFGSKKMQEMVLGHVPREEDQSLRQSLIDLLKTQLPRHF